jgi:hypothetical protein
MSTATFTAGLLRTRQMRLWMAQLGLRYTEVKGVMETAFVVSVWNDEDRRAVQRLSNHVAKLKRQEAWEEFQEHRAEVNRLNAKKLKKLNFRRKMTFRKPLRELPLELMAF